MFTGKLWKGNLKKPSEKLSPPRPGGEDARHHTRTQLYTGFLVPVSMGSGIWEYIVNLQSYRAEPSDTGPASRRSILYNTERPHSGRRWGHVRPDEGHS